MPSPTITLPLAAFVSILAAGLVAHGATPATDFFRVTLDGKKAKVLRVADNIEVFSSTEHAEAIQYAMDHLSAGRSTREKVHLVGEFHANTTIMIPSFTTLELDGRLTLKAAVNKQLIAQAKPKSGNTQIEMVGGVYNGNREEQTYQDNTSDPGYYLIRFERVTESDFTDFIAENSSSDAFVLSTYCSHNRATNLTGRDTGRFGTGISNGNGLGDRGSHNTWIDCVTSDTYSDGWVIKCQNSTFTRCIARKGFKGAGFGLFGDRPIVGNQFIDCEVQGFDGRGVTLRKPSSPEKGDDPIKHNLLQIYVHDNGTAGQENQHGVRLWSSRKPVSKEEMISNNQLDLLVTHNHEIGLYIQGPNVEHTTGTIVIHSNEIDAHIEGHDNTLTFLVPDLSKAKIEDEGINNKITIRQISPEDAATSWAAKKYYDLLKNPPH